MPPEIRIDPEFEAICRPLTDDELHGLREDIAAHGCIAPVVVWQQEGILLDGHNRVRVCRELGLPYAVKELPFGDRHRAWIWAIENQLARRNLNPLEREYMIGMRLIEERRAREENLVPGAVHGEAGTSRENTPAGSDPSSGQLDHSKSRKTRDRIAAETGVSPAKVQRAARFAEDVNRVAARGGPEVRRALLSGDVKLSRRGIEDLADHPPASLEELRAAAEAKKSERRARPSTTDEPRPFIQRGVVADSIVTRTDPTDGTEYLDHCKLTCGHVHQWKRPVVAGATEPHSVPCVDCGSGTRKPHEDRRTIARESALFLRALGDEARRDMLCQAWRAHRQSLGFRPGDPRRTRLEDERERCLKLAGMYDLRDVG